MRWVAILPILAGVLLGHPSLAQNKPVDAPDTVGIGERKSPTEMRADELDKLFAELHKEFAAPKAPTIELKIWATWGRHESITAELLLGQATKAMNAQEFQTAEDILNKLVADQPAYAEAWNRRATLHYMARRYEKSLADIDKVLELEPRHFGALSGRGMIYEAQGKPDDALKAYQEALSMNPFMSSVQENIRRLEKERPDI